MARGKPKVRASDSRIWLLKCGANPTVVPELLSCAALSSDPDWSLGDTTREECPDPANYGAFIVYDEIPGAVDNPKLSIKMRYARDLAPLLEFARSRQRADVQILIGRCNSPEDYRGWDKILVLTYAKPTKWGAEKISAMTSGDDGSANEMIDLSGVEFYEIVQLSYSGALAAADAEFPIVGIDICAGNNCDDEPCPTPCQVVIAVMPGSAPDLPSVLYTSDGGATWAREDVTTMAATDVPSDIRCAGQSVIVLDNTGNSYHHTVLDDLLAGSPTWAEVTSGFVATKLPNEGVFRSGVLFIAANGGYIYRVRGAGSVATVLEAGSLTVQNLTDIDAVDSRHVVAVGASNAVLVSDDGENFALVVGPAVGVALTAVCVLDERTWLVSTATALFSTVNAGATWATEGLPVAFTSITDIQRVDGVVYLSGISAGVGTILRNTEGGSDALGGWYVLPEGVGAIPNNDAVNKLAVCAGNHNLVYGGGLNADGIAGFLVRAVP